MIFLPKKLSDYLKRAEIKLATLVGVVTSVLSDEQTGQAAWNAGLQGGTPGTDYPATTISTALLAGDDHIHVSSTAGFTAGSTAHPGLLGLFDGSNIEIVTYTGSTDTQFTGVVRGQYGTTATGFGIGDFVFQGTFSHGPAPDGINYNLMTAERNWTQDTVTGGPPTPVQGASMVYDYTNNLYWLFGGFDGANYLNDLWKFDPTSDTWTQLSPTGGPPSGRYQHGMAFSLADEIWVFGGYGAAGGVGDVWKYLISTDTWSNVASWDFTTNCWGFAYATAGANLIYITGGSTSAGTTAITRRFNTMSPTSGWTTRLSAPNKCLQGAGCYLTKAKKFLAVGYNGAVMTCQAFDDTSNTWTVMASPPTKRLNPTLVYDDVNELALLHGGYDTGAGFKNLYSFDYLDNAWTERCEFSREGRARHVAAWSTTDKEMLMWGGATNIVTPTWPAAAYINPARFRWFWATAYWATATLGLGAAPTEDGEWLLEDITDTAKSLNGVSYTAEYSDNAADWTSIGAISDGEAITNYHRYWKIHVTLTNAGLDASARVTRLDALFDQIQYFALASRPVGQYPPIVKSIGSLSSDVDVVKNTAKIGSVQIGLLDTGGLASKVVTNSYPKNKTVKLKIGVTESDFTVAEFVQVLKTRVKDWGFDGAILEIDTADFLYDLKKDIPEEADDSTITALVYNDTGICSNPVDIILDILQNQINVPDRDLDLDSFEAVKNATALSGWKFNRTIDSPEEAKKLIEEICRLIGAALIPREDGKISLRILDTDDAVVAEWNATDQAFKGAKFDGNADSIRNFVSTWWHWDGTGDKYTDFEGCEVAVDANSVTNWGRETLRTGAKWLGDDDVTYAGSTRAAAISARILHVSENGIPVVSLETNMSAFEVQVGDMIRVRSNVLRSLPEYRAWQRKFNPTRDLAFVDETGRVSVPYLTFGCRECVDMKFWVTKKNVDFVKGAIKWELSRARGPLSVDATAQADFYLYGVAGEQVDADTTPGSVLVALDPDAGGDYFASGWFEVVFDMGQQPEQPGEWTLTDTVPAGTSIVYTAWASETGDFAGEQMPIGVITDASAISLKARWYKIRATLTSNSPDLDATPAVEQIKAAFANG